jgi:hypothetical protein
MQPQERYRKIFLAALFGFFDESGKHHEHDIVVFSGFLATWNAWEVLNEEWMRLLRVHNLDAIHFAEHQKQASLMKKCIRAIKVNVEFGVTVAVKVEAFNALPEQLKQEVGRNANYFAFRWAVFAMTSHIRSTEGNHIHLVCDEDEEAVPEFYKWYKKVKIDLPQMQRCLASICFGNDLFLPQLQAADVFAGINRQEAKRRLIGTEEANSPVHFKELTKGEEDSKLKFKDYFLDDTALRRFGNNWQSTILASLSDSGDNLAP